MDPCTGRLVVHEPKTKVGPLTQSDDANSIANHAMASLGGGRHGPQLSVYQPPTPAHLPV
jgi:hypothetical protein